MSSSSTPSSHSRSRYSHMQSVSESGTAYAPTILSNGQGTKLNVVSRVVIEGKARPGQEGASVKMYLKISLPLDSVAPGSTMPLFAEQKVKVLAAQVHPLDSNSVPYNFSATLSPMLQNAAHALNLPTKSHETFHSAFDLPPPSSPVVTSSRLPGNSENVPPVETHYAGCILVSDYHISYVVPKVLLQYKPSTTLDRSTSRGRRASITEKNHLHFMAAIDMWIPYLTTPPRSPYLLSIPTPKCLHNYIKLRINPTHPTSASMASVSSVEDDASSWNVMSEPYVTRAPHRPSRSRSWNEFADDESSDTSASGSQDSVLQGTFPSTEFLRVRWAKPLKTVDVGGDAGDGRRRVGVDDVKGEVVCGIKGLIFDQERQAVDGIAMAIQYKGTCKGIWHPGVATALGMDVGLRVKGCDVSWLEESSLSWEVNGGVGYTGFDTGKNGRTPVDPGSVSPPKAASPEPCDTLSTSHLQPSATSSLLRAPLPTHGIPDYSFETSTLTSSMPDSAVSSMPSLQTSSEAPPPPVPPGQPITLHLNINELVPPAKNLFTFTISGNIIIRPRPTQIKLQRDNNPVPSTDDQGIVGPISLPHFTVLAVKNENITTIVRNEMEEDDAIVDLYQQGESQIALGSAADVKSIRKGAFAKYNGDGGKVVIRSDWMPSTSRGRASTFSARGTRSRASSIASMALSIQQPRRRGLAKFPSCQAIVMPVVGSTPGSAEFVVRMSLNVPPLESEWLEFGFTHPSLNESHLIESRVASAAEASPRVVIADASVDGISVEHEVASTSAQRDKDSDMVLGDLKGKEWLSWCKVHVGSIGGQVVVDYQVQRTRMNTRSFMTRSTPLHILLPTFTLPVGRFEVRVEAPNGYEIIALQSNFAHDQSVSTGYRFVHSALPEFFQPNISIALTKTSKPMKSFTTSLFLLWALSFIGFALYRLDMRVQLLATSLEHYANDIGHNWNAPPDPITVTTTTTLYTTMEGWVSKPTVEIEASEAASISILPTSAVSTAPISLELPSSASSLAMVSTPVTVEAPPPPPQSILGPPEPQPPDSQETDTPEPSNDSSLSLSTESIFQSLSLPFSFSWMDDPEIKVTLRKLADVADKLWYLVLRAYHYPMNPP
ncbi:hypothetical protein AX16_004733 [Volvariella volvacea WC 439]|nr:hypothetical protein AX16_004733 [Volvariella volvacea WC 439]